MYFKNTVLVLFITLMLGFCTKRESDLGAEKTDTHTIQLSDSHNLKTKPINQLSEVNRALKAERNDKTFRNYGQLAYQKNRLHYSLGHYDSLVYFHKKFFLNPDFNVDSYNAAKQYYLMGYYYSQIVQASDSAFKNYTTSKNFYEIIGDSSWVGRNLLNMGTIQKDQNDFFGSKETLTEALKYLQPIIDERHISSCYNILATNHRRLSNPQDALKYYVKAIKTTNSPSDRLIYQTNLTAAYIDNEQFTIAIPLLQKIIEDTLLISNKKEYARALDNLAYAQWLSGKKVNKDVFLDPLQIRKVNNDKRGQIASYTHLGEFYSKKAPTLAKQYFDTVIQLSKKMKIPKAEKDALRFLMDLEPKNVPLRDRYVFLQDSLYAQEQKVKTQFAKYKYDNQIRQEENLRLEKENTKKELEASRQRNQKLLSFAMGGLVLAVSGFGIFLLVQRTKRLQHEKEITALEAIRETEAELSRRLHDDFGGKLNLAMIMLQNNANTAEIIDVVDGLYNQSRNFSREINVVDTGSNFKNELFEMLRFRTPTDTKLLLTGANDVDWESVSPISKTTLFRVLQELMINMGKHSDATLISIEFMTTPRTLKTAYADDGVGASLKDLLTKNGLRNTEKRIRAIQGSITFDSEKGNGFRAQLEIPK